MKKAKNVKKEKTDTPVSYNRSIMAAFDKQNKGKVCPLCNVKFSLATYRSHMDVCQVDENDEEVVVLASYSREEAVLLRAGPEIVIGEGDSPEKPEKSKKPEDRGDVPENLEVLEFSEPPEVNPVKRRRTEDGIEKENTNSPVKPEKPIKTSPEWENKRRSKRIAQKSVETPVEIVKKEKATISEVLEAIQNFEARIGSSRPYYLKCAIKIMKKVISTRKFDGSYYADDFWLPEDVIFMYRFVEQLSDSAKCLLMRLVVRKPGWYLVEKLEQKYPEIPNISEAAVELTRWRFFEDESSLKDLDETIILSDLTVLKNVAKKFKLDSNKTRPETVQLIKKFATSQQSIFGGVGSVESSILKSLKQELGHCVRIRPDPVNLFKSLFTLYCPTSTNSALIIENPTCTNPYRDLLYLLSEVEKGVVHFPAPNPCKNIVSLYKTRSMLSCYMTAKSIETTIVTFMANGRLAEALDLAIDAKEFIDSMTDESKRYYESLEVHERKFTSIWVLTRCVAHGATILEKQKKWGMAVEWHKNLLLGDETKNYCLDSRGIWWDRMLLNLDSHLKEKKECAKMIMLAMEDPKILDKELLMIQDRAIKLKNLPPEFQAKISIGQPEKRTITAPTISKNLGDGRVNRFVIRDSEKEEDVECSVEEVVRQRYLEEDGFTVGVHDEGATWHTLFGLLFYHVIFPEDPYHVAIASTWLSEVQDSPTDMSNTLYSKREVIFEERFKWLEEAESEDVESTIRKIWEEKKEETNKECSWNAFPKGVDDCVNFSKCIPRTAMLAIFRRLAMNYRNCRSGFPDLTLWNPTTKRIAVVEVKGPGDRLSTKQRLWLAFFDKNGIRAEVCHVTAESSKRLS